jgi:hypothetical protein
LLSLALNDVVRDFVQQGSLAFHRLAKVRLEVAHFPSDRGFYLLDSVHIGSKNTGFTSTLAGQ